MQVNRGKSMQIEAGNRHFKELNEQVKTSNETHITIKHCLGQRYIGAGLAGKELILEGIPGNALGSYLDGSTIHVMGNAQDATGDTMNEGAIYIHGSSGDATGYSMRGGKIFVKGSAGYRAGIHMKAYKDKHPVLVIGERAGSFLGEYQAGGTIIVLGIGCTDVPVGYFCGTGMHGGKIYLRCRSLPYDLPKQVVAHEADEKDLEEIKPYIKEYCQVFKVEEASLKDKPFYVLEPDTKNPYRQLYTHH